jgi:predicted ATPase
VTITGPAGGSKERLLETLRENGYSVENKRIKGRDVVQVDVLAPWHEVNR